MWTMGTFVVRAMQAAVVAGGLAIGFAELATKLKLDPIGPVREIATSVQQKTAPGNSRIVYREMIGYFPLSPVSIWEVETETDWPEFRHSVRARLAPEFELRPGSDDECLHLVAHIGDETRDLEIRRKAGDQPVAIRCTLVVFQRPSDP